MHTGKNRSDYSFRRVFYRARPGSRARIGTWTGVVWRFCSLLLGEFGVFTFTFAAVARPRGAFKRKMHRNGHINATILQTLKGHASDVTTCDFAPSFTLVTGSSDKTVRIWDWIPGTGYVERSASPLKAHKYQVTCVRVSPQGSMLASSSVDGTALLWNLHSCAKLYTMVQVNGDAIRVCRFSPDSSLLITAGDNGAVCIWDLIHRSLIRTLFEHEGTTHSLEFTPDSYYLVTACSLEVIKIWYVHDLIDTTIENTLVPVARIDNAHDMGVFCVDISKRIIIHEDNPLIRQYKMASCGNSNEIKIWTITSKSTIRNKNHTSNEVSIESSDVFDGHSSSVTCVKYSRHGNDLISSSIDKLVKIWNDDGDCVANLEGHQRYVNCVSLSKDSTLAVSGSNDKQVIVWDLTGSLTLDSELFSSYFMPATNGVTELQMLDNCDVNSEDVELLEKIDDFEGGVNSCCFYKNDILATGSGDKMVRLFKVAEENNNIEELPLSPLEGHGYAVNCVEFSRDGRVLASCSLDGCTTLWNPETGEKLMSVPKNSLSIKVCRFSDDSKLLVTAGDDEKAVIWNAETMESIGALEGHLDTVTSACFSPDVQTVVTTSCNGDFRLWSIENVTCVYVKEDAHDYGIQCCDFSQNLEPIPNVTDDGQYYLLATCGNDSFVKLWSIHINKNAEDLDFDNITVKTWRILQGHGGNVISVKFSPLVGELVCSTATDRQARIWSVYSSECLYVLDHDSIVTCCSFCFDCSLLSTGCIDKSLWIWKLPQQLVFQNAVARKIVRRAKTVLEWTLSDIVKWIRDIGMDDITEIVQNSTLDGEKLMTLSESDICSGLELDDTQTERFLQEINWLKKDERHLDKPDNISIPDNFLCPITHEIMRNPVTCSDGFTYEKNAIAEWFLSGKFTSPMTNETLSNTDYTLHLELRTAIRSFLDNSEC